MWKWLVKDWQWPAASLFAALFLFAILPLFAGIAGTALALVFAQLPIYLVHQWEEHTGDRFRAYVHRRLSGGREVLTPGLTFVINFLAVWIFDLAALYFAWGAIPAAGLAAGYLAIVNAVVHILPAIVRREYNPGLATAVVLFLPIGGWCVWEVGAGVGFRAHVIALNLAVGGHALIFAGLAIRGAMIARLDRRTQSA
jgi:hypothetical protein